MWSQGLQGHAQERCGSSAKNITTFEVSISHEEDCLSTRTDEVFLGVLAIVSGNHIHHVVPGEVKGSVKVYQAHERFNDWGGRGYDDFVPKEVTKTAPSGDETT